MEMTEALVKDEEDLIAQVLKVKKECWINVAPCQPQATFAVAIGLENALRSFPFFKVSSVLDSCRIVFWPSGCRSVIIYICETEFLVFTSKNVHTLPTFPTTLSNATWVYNVECTIWSANWRINSFIFIIFYRISTVHTTKNSQSGSPEHKNCVSNEDVLRLIAQL